MKIHLATLILLLAFCALPALADSPELSVTGIPAFGTYVFDGTDPTPVTLQIQVADPFGIGFIWSGDTSAYGGTLVGYRMGWDITDPDDPMDPGWLVSDYVLTNFTEPKIFSTVSLHTFIVEAKDDQGNITRATFWIQVVDEVPVESVPFSGLKALYR